MIIDNIVEVQTREQWRNWLSEHGNNERYCWLIRTKNDSFTYLDAVEEALCFGWIDSTVKKVNDVQTAQRFSPRSKNSNWTELNKERVRRLDKLGFMKEEGKRILPDMSPESFVIDDYILERLKEDTLIYHNFQALP